jgi:hypothetical protein
MLKVPEEEEELNSLRMCFHELESSTLVQDNHGLSQIQHKSLHQKHFSQLYIDRNFTDEVILEPPINAHNSKRAVGRCMIGVMRGK